MKKDVMVSIVGSQVGGGEEQPIHLITTGKYYVKDGAHYLEYEENELGGMEGSVTVLCIEPEAQRVSMHRQGDVQAVFVFEEKKRYVSSYQTPFGNILMGVFPVHVAVHFDEEGGTVELKYQMDIESKFASMNQLTVSFQNQMHSIYAGC
ncbi:DUF1934 domain-containing protein [Gehongia tenuis]|uniref:DUF1934 domain-containing protein n=1 Tax=Gehongia tenuis TaxID=2763655 RepID=A0A926HL58_9FIRM|nr:DUF1934 domain-containing protein [Gehongia tenuis]MBC8531707.1 DUF1934 domain-containing protein [Gehongia tenuis]